MNLSDTTKYTKFFTKTFKQFCFENILQSIFLRSYYKTVLIDVASFTRDDHSFIFMLFGDFYTLNPTY